MSEPITTQRVDHLAEMRKTIDAAISAAESAGVKPAAMIEYFEGCLNYTRQRALHQAEQVNITRMHDSRGNLIDHHGAIARAQAIREEQQRLASEREWQESVNRRAEEQRIRDEFIK
jgi:hypothetical protein